MYLYTPSKLIIMKEDFLHYLWKFKNFETTNLKTTKGEEITIINSGHYLRLAGPDFFNARIIIGTQKWAGNIEIHIKSSDWYLHQHETDAAYENVVLHVVWHHDTEIYRKDNSEIPVLKLSDYVNPDVLENYKQLSTPKSWLYCERQLQDVDPFTLKNWLDRLFFERLERKSAPFVRLLEITGYDWEASLFCFMAKNFGLNTNGDAFSSMARAIPFSVVRKESTQPENLQAILFGMAGLLEDQREDLYFKSQKQMYDFLSHKYQLSQPCPPAIEFFRHRPDNFPTIRLSQLSQLYATIPNLFSQIIETPEVNLYHTFSIGVSEYWQTHYQFDRPSPKKAKMLTRSFIDLLIVNAVIPVKFAHAVHNGKDISQSLIEIMQQIPSEKNVVIDKFASFGIKSASSLESQALLQLKNEYCNKSKCLQCGIGTALLKSTNKKTL